VVGCPVRSGVSGRDPAKSRPAPKARTCLWLEAGSRPGTTRSRGARPRRGDIGQIGRIATLPRALGRGGAANGSSRAGTPPLHWLAAVRGRSLRIEGRRARPDRRLRRHATPSHRLEPVEAHHRTSHQHEREPASRIPVPAHLQPPKATQPRQGPLDLPPMAPQPGRRLKLPPGDPRLDPTPAQPGPVGPAVIALICMDRTGAGAPPPRRCPDRWDVLHDGLEHGGVVNVGRGHHGGQGQPAAVTDQLQLGSRLATIDGICAHLVPPRLARTLMVSTAARSHSSWPRSPRRSKTTRWS